MGRLLFIDLKSLCIFFVDYTNTFKIKLLDYKRKQDLNHFIVFNIFEALVASLSVFELLLSTFKFCFVGHSHKYPGDIARLRHINRHFLIDKF